MICSDFGAPKNKVWQCFHCFPIYFPWSDGTWCHDLSFLRSSITSWQIEGEKVDALIHFLFWGPKITVDSDCSHEIRSCLLLSRKAMKNLNSVLKSKDIRQLTYLQTVKVMVFSGVMYGCESWTIKKVECRKIDVFKLWCWRRLLRAPWAVRRSKQSILKEIDLEYTLEGLMLKLKLLYFGHLMPTADSLEKFLMLGKIKGKRRRRIRLWDYWIAPPMQLI